jgi:hypothetical protein
MGRGGPGRRMAAMLRAAVGASCILFLSGPRECRRGLARVTELGLVVRMHRGRLVVMVAAAAIVAACGGEVTSSRGDALGTAGSGRAAHEGSPEGGTRSAEAPDAGPASIGPNTAPASVLYDCLVADVGASSPELFAELDYELQACAGPGSDCLDMLVVRADCSVSLQVRNEPHNATATPKDCAALARWATSQVLARALDDLPACSPGSGNPPEMTEVQLVTGPGPRKKTGLCREEPYLSHRACMASVRARYFPAI